MTKPLLNHPGRDYIPPPVYALNRCHLSNWRFNPETVHFELKKAFLADHVCVQMLQNKAFWPRFTFSQEAETWKEKSLFLQC